MIADENANPVMLLLTYYLKQNMTNAACILVTSEKLAKEVEKKYTDN
ncbi:MAG: hypothetical protein ACLRQZ_07330 [Clostridia bacterium]